VVLGNLSKGSKYFGTFGFRIRVSNKAKKSRAKNLACQIHLNIDLIHLLPFKDYSYSGLIKCVILNYPNMVKIFRVIIQTEQLKCFL